MSENNENAPVKATSALIADILKPTLTKTAWVEFKEGIMLEVAFVSKSKFKLITDQCTVLQYDPRSKVHQPKIDASKMIDLFVREAVKNWKNVTPRKLSQIAPIDLTNVEASIMDSEIPFSHEALAALTKETYELDSFVQEAAMDVRCFQQTVVPKEDAAKN